MEQIKPKTTLGLPAREAATEYLFEMIIEMARLARDSGEVQTAIHLEAIIAARRATVKDPSATDPSSKEPSEEIPPL